MYCFKSSLHIYKIFRHALILSIVFAFPALAGWVVMQKSDPEFRDYMAIAFTNKKNGWVAGSALAEDFENPGFIGYTMDSGTTWEKADIKLAADLTGIYFLDEKHGWVIGAKGLIANTSNGKDWEVQISKVDATLKSVFFVDKDVGYAAGENDTILSTTNGGRRWVILHGGQVGAVGDDEASMFNAVQFISKDTGWVAGVRVFPATKTQKSIIQKTMDSGKTWVTQETGTEDILEDIFFVDEKTGWAVGENGLILYTQNGGDLWTPQTSGTEEKLSSVRFADKNMGWAVGGDYGVGVVLSTTDGGETWEAVESKEKMVKVFVLDKQNVWLAGASGIILKTE